MPAFIALLRGINVGKAKRVRMEDLRGLLSGLGYTHVATLLNSGNAVFSAAGGKPEKHAVAIAAAIAQQLQVDVPVIVQSASTLDAIVAGNPLASDTPDHSRLLVAFVQDTASLAAMASIASIVVAPEQFVVGRHAAYLHCPSGILESKAAAALLGKVGNTATTRNWATVLKLRALASKQRTERLV